MPKLVLCNSIYCYAGDIEDYPGLDSIHSFKVTLENGNVKVRAKKSDLLNTKRVKPMRRTSPDNDETYVIIGGGPSGAVCAETIRQEGFEGRVVVICNENYLPYDRVKLSKQLHFEIEKAQLRTASFYDSYDIEMKLGVAAESVDCNEKSISLSNNETLRYDKVFIATGSRPIELEVEGHDLENVVVLRNTEHAKHALKLLLPENEIVILGGSFIGIEMAAYSSTKVGKVTVVMRDDVPYRNSFGFEVGERIKSLCESHGVIFLTKSSITKCIGKDGILTAVEINGEHVIKANLLLLGIGTVPNTDFLRGSGIAMNPNGTIIVDKFMKTNIEDVYAGGDIAYAPVYCNFNQPAAIGHYPLAHYHGKVAAMNMVDHIMPLRSVPFFWTMIYGKSFRYTGYGKHTSLQIEGSLEDLSFVVYYFDEQNRVIGMMSANKDPIVSLYAEWLANGKHLFKHDLEGDPLAWTRQKIE